MTTRFDGAPQTRPPPQRTELRIFLLTRGSHQEATAVPTRDGPQETFATGTKELTHETYETCETYEIVRAPSRAGHSLPQWIASGTDLVPPQC